MTGPVTGEGGSAVGRAVAQLTAALGRSEEAQLHGREALARVTDAWALHRQAAADTEAESMASAVRLGASARAGLMRSVGLLKAGDESIVSYIGKIAPGLKISVSGKEASFPKGAALLETQRPRNGRAARNFVLREADKPREAIGAVNEAAHNAVSFIRPPQPTGQHTSQPAPGPTLRSPDSGVVGDPIQTITVLAVVTVKAAEIALEKALSKMRRLRK